MDKNYAVSARKYRPSTFASVIGQQALTHTLKNAILSGRLAQAYLFCGPRGVGKTSCARIFAKTINCSNRTPEGEACGHCDSCLDFQRGHSYNVIELDAASNNGVDQMRTLTEQVNIPPQVGNYRVFIIDEVHMLSPQAFNAFLKTLEEPPSYAIFVLATTEKNKVLPTILSRCQIYDFARITNDDIADHLSYVATNEGIPAERAALDVIASKADGAMRDALSLFDQVSASTGNNLTYQATINNLNVLDHEYYFRFADAFKAGDVATSLLLYKEVRNKGFDSQFFVNGLASHLRNLMVAYSESTLPLLEVSRAEEQRYLKQSHLFSPQWYYAALKILSDCDLNFRIATDKLLLVELSLIRICQLLQPTTPIGDGGNGGGNGSTGAPMRRVATTGSAASAAPTNAAQAAPVAQAQTAQQPVQQPAQQRPVQAAPVQPEQAQSAQAQPTQAQPTQPQQAPVASSPDSVAAFLSPGAKPHIIHPPLNTTPAAPRNSERTRSIRLRTAAKQEAEVATEQHVAQARNTPITKEALENAWLKFTDAHPDLKIIVNCMRRCFPHHVEGDTYRIYVDNQAQIEEFEQNMMLIHDFICDTLANDNFVLNVMLSSEVHFDRLLTKPDMIKKIRDEYPDIMQLLLYLDAEVM